LLADAAAEPASDRVGSLEERVAALEAHVAKLQRLLDER
jgi:hypothetical protein